jgi:hypothetical protein
MEIIQQPGSEEPGEHQSLRTHRDGSDHRHSALPSRPMAVEPSSNTSAGTAAVNGTRLYSPSATAAPQIRGHKERRVSGE